ncbi:MAG: hypothetical protein COA91_04665 [Robiginitomaculum sp.]|nr:MAG: hypothetical protein COA91_04665 [Robiginitomaculum sp.]
MLKSSLIPVAILALMNCAPAQNVSDVAATAQDHAGVPVTLGTTHSIPSSVYGMQRRISVKLPIQYTKTESENFPVLYLIDGGPEQDFPHIAGMLQSIDINWTLEPIILVGVETVNRRYEVSPPSNDPRYAEAMGSKLGGSQELRDFIRKDVMPWVETNYRVSDDRMVMGESLAGLWVVETLLKEPDMFTKYAAVSPSLWWENMDVAKSSKDAFTSFPYGEQQLYLTMGNEGWNMQKGLDILIENLEQGAPDGLKWSYIDRRDLEDHGSIYHPAALDALRLFYPLANRTGQSAKAFYMFDDGISPPLSEMVKKDLKIECTNETARITTFAEVAKNHMEWNGLCVQMKLGAARTKGN